MAKVTLPVGKWHWAMVYWRNTFCASNGSYTSAHRQKENLLHRTILESITKDASDLCSSSRQQRLQVFVEIGTGYLESYD